MWMMRGGDCQEVGWHAWQGVLVALSCCVAFVEPSFISTNSRYLSATVCTFYGS